MDERAVDQPRSVSQLSQYDNCPYRYYLSRVKRVWQRPAAWLSQGTAVHAAIEGFEKTHRIGTVEDMESAFVDAYADATGELTEDTPNLRMWFRSGPYDGKADIERRFGIGLEQTRKYHEYTLNHPEEVPFTKQDGTPYVEHPWTIKLGDVTVRGFTDQVVWDPELKQWVVRDCKTGKSPGNGIQLSTYGVAFEDEYGIKMVKGDYWMARTGKPTIHYDLDDYSREQLTNMFGQLDENIKAEEFPAKPEPDKCRFCDVAASCEFRAAEQF